MSNSYSDGQYIKRHTLDVFDVESSEMKVTISRDEEFNNLAFSPDGKLVAFWGGARDPRLLTIDLETKKINHEIHPDIDYVRRILFSPDGKLIYTTADMRPLEQGKSSPYLRVFEVATEKFLAVFAPSILPGVAGNVFTSDFDLSADGKRIALALRDSSDSDKDAAGLPDIVVFDAQ
jgi:WD40 repeat protein